MKRVRHLVTMMAVSGLLFGCTQQANSDCGLVDELLDEYQAAEDGAAATVAAGSTEDEALVAVSDHMARMQDLTAQLSSSSPEGLERILGAVDQGDLSAILDLKDELTAWAAENCS